ncbi:MAG: 4-hydroxy-tetrahydrodipicolinate reductase [Rhodobacteraceae bacterium]|nr:4-hydroxy-tetrahydrodipicolinate reductase [Paracoccaceae bacterium]
MARLKIGVSGLSGRMGRTLAAFIQDHGNVELAGATEHQGHPWIGTPVSECLNGLKSEVRVLSDAGEAFQGVEAVIDFTTPSATVANAAVAGEFGIVHVIGTTGLTAEDLAEISRAAESAVIVRAGNMSLGVNLLTRLTERVAASLDEEFDIEVLETHHRYKVDAPSGTALMLGRAARLGRGDPGPELKPQFHVSGTGPRRRGEIGYAAVRGGDVVGEHDVIFAADGERITLRHVATDRVIYARGAVKAAIWGQGRAFGGYDMVDVLGL